MLTTALTLYGALIALLASILAMGKSEEPME